MLGKVFGWGVKALLLILFFGAVAAGVLFGGAQSVAGCDSEESTLINTALSRGSAAGGTYSIVPASSVAPKLPKLEPEQISVAKQIIAIGKQRGLNDRDIVIALMTAMQESGMRNLSYGDGLPDTCSLGVFQQQWCLVNPTTGKPVWGTKAQVTNVTYSINRFYKSLEYIKNRGSMRLTQAAQAVQRSAFPEAYAKHEPLARALVAKYGDGVMSIVSTAGANPNCTTGVAVITAAVQAAEGMVGSKPKTPDGSNPDGTSLVTWAYRTAGVTVGTDASKQLSQGVGVDDRRDLTRGDLLYYGAGKEPSSVVMYVDGETVIGIGAKQIVRKLPLSWKHYKGAVRPVPMPHRVIAVGTGANGGTVAAGKWTVPIQGSYRVSSGYGSRGQICTSGGCTVSGHDGVDLATPSGRPILAASSGKIVEKATDPYGWHITIDHGDGIKSLYGHMSKFANFGVGDTVQGGEVIGYVGQTGKATGPHLHFTIWVNGRAVEPVQFMKNHGVVIR